MAQVVELASSFWTAVVTMAPCSSSLEAVAVQTSSFAQAVVLEEVVVLEAVEVAEAEEVVSAAAPSMGGWRWDRR